MIAALCLWVMTTAGIDPLQPVDVTGAEAVSLLSELENRDEAGAKWANAMYQCYAASGEFVEALYQQWTLECYLQITRYLDVVPSALLNEF